MVRRASCEITFKHVKGHVDRERPCSQWTRIETIQVACDEAAETCVKMGLTPDPFRPLPGARCMLRVQNRWISQKAETALSTLPALAELKTYLTSRLKLDPEVVEEIDQEAISAVRATHSWARTVRVSKLLSYWLPVGHNWGHHGADNDLCPCCGAPDETFSHLLRCQAPSMIELRQQILTKVIQIGHEVMLPSPIVRLLELMLRSCFGDLPSDPPLPSVLQKIWSAQKRIGLINFAHGWISTGWAVGLKKLGSKDPHGQSAQVLTLVWDAVCEPIWEHRNHVLNNTPNPTALRELSSLRDRLLWYRRFKNQVLPPRFRFLARFRPDQLERWDRTRCRVALRQLDKARRIYEIECTQRVRGQQVMTGWLSQRVPSPSPSV